MFSVADAKSSAVMYSSSCSGIRDREKKKKTKKNPQLAKHCMCCLSPRVRLAHLIDEALVSVRGNRQREEQLESCWGKRAVVVDWSGVGMTEGGFGYLPPCPAGSFWQLLNCP